MRPKGKPYNNIIGKRFGKLVAIETAGQDPKSRAFYWKCLCDCGKETVVRIGRLSSGDTKSCGCLRKVANKSAQFNDLFYHYTQDAYRRGYEFGISKRYFKYLAKQNCYYCGIEPEQVFKRAGLIGKYIYNGVDRKNNKLGYTKDNSVSCCGKCNRMKMILSDKEFINQTIKIADRWK